MIGAVHSNLLFLGNAFDARDLKSLYEHGIAAVVDLAVNEKPAQLGRDMIYFRLPISDSEGNSDALLELAIDSLLGLLQRDVRTLVACSTGMSRSPVIAAAALALLTQKPFDLCLTEIAADRPHDVSPLLLESVKRVYEAHDSATGH